MLDNRIKGLSHVNLNVSDIERSVKFYSDILGFEEIYSFGGQTPEGMVKCAFIRCAGITIEMKQSPKYDTMLKDGHYDHIALLVEDIEGLAQSLRDRGVQFESEVVHSQRIWPNGSKWILFRGPDGEHFELNEIL